MACRPLVLVLVFAAIVVGCSSGSASPPTEAPAMTRPEATPAPTATAVPTPTATAAPTPTPTAVPMAIAQLVKQVPRSKAKATSASAVTAAIARASEGGPAGGYFGLGNLQRSWEECQGRYRTSVHGPDEAYIEGGCTSTAIVLYGRYRIEGNEEYVTAFKALLAYFWTRKDFQGTAWDGKGKTADMLVRWIGDCQRFDGDNGVMCRQLR